MKVPLTVHRNDAVELGDLRRLRRAAVRTSGLRVLLAAALAATLVGIVVVARGAGAGRVTVLPAGATPGCVAVDMSASIFGGAIERIATTLKGIVNANQAVCLVMFSDTAYELLPPNSPPRALQQFIRFFTPVQFAQSPWAGYFDAGTRISTGLATAEQALHRAGVKHKAILLVSDLHDSSTDQPALNAEALRLHHEQIPVRIVSLFAVLPDKDYFAALFGSNTFVDPSVFRHAARQRLHSVAGSGPWGLLTLGAVLVLLLFGNERWNTRLAVGVPE